MPPGRRDDRGLVLGNDTIQRIALLAAERRRAGHLDQIGDARAIIFLDPAVEFDERPIEMLRQHSAERRLAGAAQTDQRDALAAIRTAAHAHARGKLLGQGRQFLFRHLRQQIEDRAKLRGAGAGLRQQRRSGKIERLRDSAQHADRRIAGATFDLRQISFRSLGGLRQLPARHAALGAVLSHLPADGGEECGRLCRLAGRNDAG